MTSALNPAPYADRGFQGQLLSPPVVGSRSIAGMEHLFTGPAGQQ